MTKEEMHADLTANVITQEFTNCSIKAVRLADRIIEWHDKQNTELKSDPFWCSFYEALIWAERNDNPNTKNNFIKLNISRLHEN